MQSDFTDKTISVKGRKTAKVLLIFFVFAFVSISWCNSKQTLHPVFSVGKSFSYTVTVLQHDTVSFVDTLSFQIKKKGILGGILGMNMTKWTSVKYPDYSEKRGINLSEEQAGIQMPLNLSYLDNEYIIIAPYPAWSKTSKVGYTTEISHTYAASYGRLAGKNMKQEIKVLDSVVCKTNSGLELICKQTLGKNTSRLKEYGEYRVTTLYNDDLGFCRNEIQLP